MRGKIITITVIATVDAFFIGFAVGFNSKHAAVEDPSLPPVSIEKIQQNSKKTSGNLIEPKNE